MKPTTIFLIALLLAQKDDLHAEAKTDGGKPNVILIMTDDQGYGDMACHGNPDVKTPEMDRLEIPTFSKM